MTDRVFQKIQDTLDIVEKTENVKIIYACESGYGMVPMEFATLADKTIKNSELKAAVDRLLDLKKTGNELDMGDRIPVISGFLDHEIRRLSVENEKMANEKKPETLDQVFVEVLKSVNGNNI